MMRRILSPLVLAPVGTALLLAGCADLDETDTTDTTFSQLTADAAYAIVQLKGGRCVHFAGDSDANMTPAELMKCDGSNAHAFAFEPSGAGYQLRNVATNRCLDVLNWRTTAGTAVIEFPCSGAANQRWRLEPVGTNTYLLRAEHSGLVLSSAGGGKLSGTDLVQDAWRGGTFQTWSLKGHTLPPSAQVNLAASRQTVDGFGMANAWGAGPSSANLDAFFSVTKGAGLSILRNRVPFREAPSANDNFMGAGNYNFTLKNAGTPNQYKEFSLNWNNWDLAATRNLIRTLESNPDYQIGSYFSTPWTPPNNKTSRWKLGVKDYTNHPEIGGYLDPAHYADYADVLADYALGFEAAMGAPLAALSIQNEPNFPVEYESADWTAAQMRNFLAVMKARFKLKGVHAAFPQLKVIAAEDANFNDGGTGSIAGEDLLLPTLADPTTADAFQIAGFHQYEFGPWNAASYVPVAPAKSVAAKKRIWMTEWSTAAFGDDSIATNLQLARLIHDDFTKASLNAFIYWWAPSLMNGNVPARKLSTLGQYSRFIRPGWVRVDASSPSSTLLTSAFRDPTNTRTAIVVVNRGTTAQTITLDAAGKRFNGVTPYRTSATEAMAKLPSLPGKTSQLTVTLAPQSITTFSAGLL